MSKDQLRPVWFHNEINTLNNCQFKLMTEGHIFKGWPCQSETKMFITSGVQLKHVMQIGAATVFNTVFQPYHHSFYLDYYCGHY